MRTLPPDAPARRAATPLHLAAARAVMRLFISEDLAHGVSPTSQLFCCACQSRRPMPGFVQYGESQLCNDCATEYEVLRIAGIFETVDQYLLEANPAG